MQDFDKQREYTEKEIEHIERTYDCSAPDADLNTREYLIVLQSFTREAATAVGLHRSCRLPKCRRMRRCVARRPLGVIGGGNPWGDPLSAFPPCVDSEEERALVAQEFKRKAAEDGED